MKCRPCTVLASAVVLLLAAACTTAPAIDGKLATEYTGDQLVDLAESAAREGDSRRTAELAEFVLRHHFDHPRRDRARWLAAEARYELGDYPDALIHYRRVLEDDPLSIKAQEIPDRLIMIGKTLIREKSSWAPDFSSRHDIGVEALTILVTHFPSQEHADDAWRELALSFREDGRHQAAADCFERLARDFPEGEWSDFALYNVAAEYRTMSRGGSYDVDPLLVAWGALGRYLEVFPDGNFASAATDERRAIESEITRREIAVADFYRFRGSADGERLHLKNAARRFPQVPEAALAEHLAKERGIDLEGADSTDLLRQRVDRPKWSSATERSVGDEPVTGRD